MPFRSVKFIAQDFRRGILSRPRAVFYNTKFMARNFKAWNSRRRSSEREISKATSGSRWRKMATRGGLKRKISKRFDLRREAGMRVGVSSEHQNFKSAAWNLLFVSARRILSLREAALNFIVSATCLKAWNFKLLRRAWNFKLLRPARNFKREILLLRGRDFKI